MQLIIRNKLINASFEQIFKQLREETGNRFFKDIIDKRTDLVVTCCWHKNGQERHPSLSISTDPEDKDYGCYHCFTCGESGFITKLIGHCFDEDEIFGEEWLIERFADAFVERQELLPSINLDNSNTKYLDPSILIKYRQTHPYMFKRHLTEDVINLFNVGYNPETDSITFPVWDVNNNLVMITERSVNSKRFYIPADVIKPVYLLNYIIYNSITSVYVCESQINALSLWSWGYPAIALMGTGSEYQYKALRRSGIRNYCLCFDGDAAGDKGNKRFRENMSDDVLISSKIIPRGKDVNDLCKSEFDSLPIIY